MKHITWYVVDVAARVIEWTLVLYKGSSRMSQFTPALDYVLAREKGIEEQASDPGKITNRGISLRTLKDTPPEKLRMYGIPVYVDADTVRNLTPEQTEAFYKGEFWNNAPFYKINNQDVCNYLFDTCVNMYISPGVKCLQRALWAVARDRSILVDDGILGEETLAAVNGASPAMVLAAMRSERGGEYRLIAERKPVEGKEDLEGWLNRSYNQKA